MSVLLLMKRLVLSYDVDQWRRFCQASFNAQVINNHRLLKGHLFSFQVVIWRLFIECFWNLNFHIHASSFSFPEKRELRKATLTACVLCAYENMAIPASFVFFFCLCVLGRERELSLVLYFCPSRRKIHCAHHSAVHLSDASSGTWLCSCRKNIGEKTGMSEGAKPVKFSSLSLESTNLSLMCNLKPRETSTSESWAEE